MSAITLAVVEFNNSNPANQADMDELLEVTGNVIEEPQQQSLRFVMETLDAEQKQYQDHVGERRVVEIWARGKLLRYVARLDAEGFEIPYSLTSGALTDSNV
jgi:hypothetical protein